MNLQTPLLAISIRYNQEEAVCAGGREGAASARRGVNVLRSHVAEAQARANHIVDEFESMLMVTGGHSMKEVKHIQSQAGLASDSPSTGKDRKLVGCHDFLYIGPFLCAQSVTTDAPGDTLL